MNSIEYILNRFKEPSTWSAIAILCGLVGYELSVEYAMEVATASFVLVNVFWKRDSQAA